MACVCQPVGMRRYLDTVHREDFTATTLRRSEVSAMRRFIWLIVGVATLAGSLGTPGCAPRRAAKVPEQDLTPFEQLMRAWTKEYQFRRMVGGDDLVSEQSAIIERPTHEERLLIEATLFADTLVRADVARLCEEDTTNTQCDTIASRYDGQHNWPEQFRIEVYVLATLSEPFQLEPLTIYLSDEDGIDYEPRRRVFSSPVTEERTYLDREVKRYDPYTSWEYRVYRYSHGYEYQSTGHATLYFDRTNIIGKDLLGPDARLTLLFRQSRTELARITWDISKIQGVLKQKASL